MRECTPANQTHSTGNKRKEAGWIDQKELGVCQEIKVTAECRLTAESKARGICADPGQILV
jgi:hypothetical protein